MNPEPAVSSILVFHAGALGDLVNTLPALEALRRAFPAASITAAGRAEFMELLRTSGLCDRAVSLETPGMHELFSPQGPGSSGRRFLEGHELAVSWIRSRVFLENLSRAGLRVSALRKDFPPPPGSPHVTEVLREPVAALGITEFPPSPRLRPREEWLPEGPVFPGLVVHPGSGSPRKNWPAPLFAEAAKEIAERAELEIAILSGPADQQPAEELAEILGTRAAACFRGLSLPGLVRLLMSARLVLGNDSGVSHLAGALGTRVVAVFGSTDPRIWGVRQEHAVNVAGKLSGKSPGFPDSPGPVVEKALQLLERVKS